MEINDLVLARALHVLGIVLWIGGVAMETSVLLPALRRTSDVNERIAWFKKIEHGFIWQVRFSVLLVGLTGLYMLFATDGWSRFMRLDQWWLHAMVMVWAIFAAVIFILEPLVLHRWFDRRVAQDPDAAFALIARLHWFLLTVSLGVVVAGIVGAHGGFLFAR